jgi:4-diphosphocytidyl-2-C-methyl-D-erythritol kinase
MIIRVTIEAPAKLNLHLAVFPRRGDGYHGIQSVFQAVSLSDTLLVARTAKQAGCEISGMAGLPTASNTIHAAWRIFHETYKVEGGVDIAVVKRIPQGAGLGGGSSDAAAALRAFRSLFDIPADDEALAAMGARVGSDVPFFCRTAAAVVGGRGERIVPMAARRDFGLVLAVPDFPVSTAQAYAWLDQAGATDRLVDRRDESDLMEVYTSRPADWGFFNAFARVLEPRFPVYARLRTAMTACGARFFGISGSGSACYGVYDSPGEAARAELRLAEASIHVVQTLPLESIPAGIVQ